VTEYKLPRELDGMCVTISVDLAEARPCAGLAASVYNEDLGTSLQAEDW
jgi:hypothetical protein